MLDLNFEAKTLACLLRSNQFCAVAAQHMSPSHFEGAMRKNLAKMALDFHGLYGTHLTGLGFVNEMKKLVKAGTLKKAEVNAYTEEYKALAALDISDWEYVLKENMTFIKGREMRALIEDAVKKHLPKDDFEAIEKQFGKIAAISMRASVEPVDYYDEKAVDDRSKRREDEKASRVIGISTGIKQIDAFLPSQGWRRKELYIIMGGAKRGKTMAMLWFAYCASLQGFNVPYFSCEVSREVIEDRLDAMIANVEINKLPDNIRHVADRVKLTRPTGRIFIYEYPTRSLSVPEMRRQIQKLEMEKGISVDMIVSDYAQIMKASRRYADDPLREEASIFEDHRKMAGEFGIPVITGSQTNRAGSTKAVVKGTDTGGTFEKIAIADGTLTLSARDEELAGGFMRIRLSEMRNAPSKTFKIKTDFGMGRFYREFVEVEEEEAA
jgi:replicative DNA helicase